jgi:hypothetical protein
VVQLVVAQVMLGLHPLAVAVVATQAEHQQQVLVAQE